MPSVKVDQQRLHENIIDALECAEHDGFLDVAYTEKVNKDHGRLEI